MAGIERARDLYERYNPENKKNGFNDDEQRLFFSVMDERRQNMIIFDKLQYVTRDIDKILGRKHLQVGMACDASSLSWRLKVAV